MGLIGQDCIDTTAALALYAQAEQMAKENAQSKEKKTYGAEEIADELDKLLSPILMVTNLLDDKEYFRLDQLIKDWYSEHETGKCAAVQMNLINLLPVLKQQQHHHHQLKATVSEFRQHLEKKAQQEGCLRSEGDKSNQKDDSRSPKQKKLMMRYEAMQKLDETIKEKPILSETDVQQAKAALQTCMNNKPDWSERPFLQKLTDLLSLGFKALYRAYCSREREMEESLGRKLNCIFGTENSPGR